RWIDPRRQVIRGTPQLACVAHHTRQAMSFRAPLTAAACYRAVSEPAAWAGVPSGAASGVLSGAGGAAWGGGGGVGGRGWGGALGEGGGGLGAASVVAWALLVVEGAAPSAVALSAAASAVPWGRAVAPLAAAWAAPSARVGAPWAGSPAAWAAR